MPCAIATVLMLGCGTALAQGADSAADAETLDPITIEDEAIPEPGTRFDDNASVSTINSAEIERRQAKTVYEVLDAVPGISVQGGPRASGQGLVIRGFDSNEDILVRIDGATQNFEKYRYGSGLSIDAELLKSIEVHRGPATTKLGTGALGGVVLLRTKDAVDLLPEGREFGARVKVGIDTNNEGRLLSLTGFGQPVKAVDLLASIVRRNSDNIALPDGSRLEDSEETQRSALGKVTLHGDRFGKLALSTRFQSESGLEPFDATGGGPGVGGTVRRSTRETAGSAKYDLSLNRAVNLSALFGATESNVTDEESSIAGGPMGGTDEFDYRIRNWEISNESYLDTFGLDTVVTAGVQRAREHREVIRTNVGGSGFNEAQPPGLKRNVGGYLQIETGRDNWSVVAGARLDRFKVSARGGTHDTLSAQGGETDARFSRVSPSFGASYRPRGGPITLFYNYSEAFRPPLIDEYFAAGILSRCFSHTDFTVAPVAPTLVIPPGTPILEQIRLINEFNAAFAAFQAASAAFTTDPFANNKAVCGDRYEPETAASHELGINFITEALFDEDDELSARFVIFHTRVDNLLESIFENSVTGEISQPGVEVHRGVELEVSYESPAFFTSLSAAFLGGYVKYNYFDNNANELVTDNATPGDRAAQDLFNIPGDSITFTIGRRLRSQGIEFGYRLRAVTSRLVTTGFKPGCDAGLFVIPTCFEIGEQGGYGLHNLFFSWEPNESLRIAASMDNVTNKQYRLSGFGGGTGTVAPGRSLRLSLRYQF
ncbi:MAG: TonB-dependent receptor [Pseudomonadota bacterium]